MSRNIEEIRIEINQIDNQIRELFIKRMKCTEEIAIYKKENNLPILDIKREKEIIANNISKIEDENLKEYYLKFLENLMMLSKEYQREKR